MRGDLTALGDDLLGGAESGRAADHRRARAEGAGAPGDLVGIALKERNLVEIEAELLGQDDLVHGLVALALCGCADDERGRSRRIEADLRGLGAGRRRGALDRVDDADTAPLAVLLRFRAALRE